MPTKPILIVQNWAVESPGLIEDYLKEQNLHHNVVRTFKNEPLLDPEDFSFIIILGFSGSVNDYTNNEAHRKLFTFIASAVRQNSKLLAICYGSQMLAKILGAEIKPHTVKEIGTYLASLTEEGKNDPFFAGCDEEFDVFHWHGDTFRLPFGSVHLAKGERCAMQAFRHNNQVGIQFHVEPKPEEVPLWCDEYSAELKEVGKSKDQIVESFMSKAESIETLCYRLLNNFLGY